MREIKFRIWNKKTKEMEYPEVFCVKQGKQEVVGWEDIIPMQYTGLKDKNGVEIYEGDILQAGTKGYEGDWPGGIIVIDHIFEVGSNSHESEIRREQMEVIGNIYENPELLDKLNK